MNIEYVMKMGGSVLYDMDRTKRLLSKLENSRNHNTVYTVGSGYLGEVYKEWANDKAMPRENSVKCWSNIQSINANILASINPNFIVCESTEMIARTLKDGKRPIVDARAFHDDFKDLEYQTTDVRSAALCKKLNCKNLVIITDVDGIFTEDPRVSKSTKKISRINAKELMNMGRTSVDKGLAEKLIEYGITGYVVGVDSIIKEKENEKIINQGTIIEHE